MLMLLMLHPECLRAFSPVFLYWTWVVVSSCWLRWLMSNDRDIQTTWFIVITLYNHHQGWFSNCLYLSHRNLQLWGNPGESQGMDVEGLKIDQIDIASMMLVPPPSIPTNGDVWWGETTATTGRCTNQSWKTSVKLIWKGSYQETHVVADLIAGTWGLRLVAVGCCWTSRFVDVWECFRAILLVFAREPHVFSQVSTSTWPAAVGTCLGHGLAIWDLGISGVEIVAQLVGSLWTIGLGWCQGVAVPFMDSFGCFSN